MHMFETDITDNQYIICLENFTEFQEEFLYAIADTYHQGAKSVFVLTSRLIDPFYNLSMRVKSRLVVAKILVGWFPENSFQTVIDNGVQLFANVLSSHSNGDYTSDQMAEIIKHKPSVMDSLAAALRRH